LRLSVTLKKKEIGQSTIKVEELYIFFSCNEILNTIGKEEEITKIFGIF